MDASPTPRTRLAILPQRWFDHPDVGADEIAVLAVLALHADTDGVCWPSQGLLAGLLGRSRPWVNRVIARLCDIGLLGKVRRHRDDHGDRSCLYRLDVDRISAQPDACSPVASSVPDPDTGCPAGDTRKEPEESQGDALQAGATATMRNGSGQGEVPPDGWCPSDDALLWAMGRFPGADIAGHIETFVAKCRAKGYAFRDLEAGWRSWVLQDMAERAPCPAGKSFGPPAGRRGGPPPSHQRFNAWAAAASSEPRAA